MIYYLLVLQTFSKINQNQTNPFQIPNFSLKLKKERKPKIIFLQTEPAVSVHFRLIF